MNANPTFREKDYPGLYQAADAESIRTQQIYFRGLRWFLILLILGALINFFAGDSKIFALMSAGAFISSLFLSVFIAVRRDDRNWYSARAVAESVKTRSWRYMMRTEPYQNGSGEARNCFLADLKEILEENINVTKRLDNESAVRDLISGPMEEIRALAMQDRLTFYIKHRVEEQRDWYQRKAKANRRDEIRWFIFIVGLNSLAIICVLLRIAFTNWSSLPSGVFAVAAASLVCWLQAKRFSELTTSYVLTTHEITIIKAGVPTIYREEELSHFVSDTENAFSREHTQWAARRDTRCRTAT